MQKFNASKFLRNFLRGTIMRQKYKFPDFLIIGTMKGGTTRLYDFITMHSAIERAKQKEIHYFSLYYNKGDELGIEAEDAGLDVSEHGEEAYQLD